MDAQKLAQALHEVAAEVAAPSLPPDAKPTPWDKLSDFARAHFVAQAERLLHRFDVAPRMDKHEVTP